MAKVMNRIKSRISWSLWGFFLAAIFGAITVYTEFVRDEGPAIQFEVLSNSSVLDVREEVPNLAILYSGTDLTETGQSLRIIVVRVRNVGSEDILKSYYDEKAPLGFRIADGSIINVELQDSSEEYLEENLDIEATSSSQVKFAPIILGPEQHFTIKALIIHIESSTPSIIPTGRVARVKSIKLTSLQELQEPGFWTQVLSGSLSVHLVRVPIYLVGLVIFGLVIVIPISLIDDKLTQRRRKAEVKAFKEQTDHEIPRSFQKIFSEYIEYGSWILTEFDTVMSSSFDLNYAVQQIEHISGDGTKSKGFHMVRNAKTEDDRERKVREEYSTTLVAQMMDYGWVESAGVGFTVDSSIKSTLKEFVIFVA